MVILGCRWVQVNVEHITILRAWLILLGPNGPLALTTFWGMKAGLRIGDVLRVR